MPVARYQPRSRTRLRTELIGRVVGAIFSNTRAEIGGSGAEVQLFGNPSLVPTAVVGYARRFTAADQAYATISPPPGLVDFSLIVPFTIICVFTPQTLGVATRILSYRHAADNVGIQLGFTTSNRLGYWFGNSGGSGAVRGAGASTLLEVGKPCVAVFGWDGAHFLYIDGVPQAVNSIATFVTSNSGTNTDINIARRNTASSYFDGSISLFAHIRGPVDAAALSQNPWQMFDIEDDDYEIPASVSRLLPVSAAAMLLSAGDVAMRVSRRAAVQAAPLQLSGGDVALRAARALGVQPAAMSLATGAAAVMASRRLSVAPVSMALVGRAVQFAYTPADNSGAYALQVDPAAMSLAGGEVRMRVSRRAEVSAAQLALSPGVVALRATRRVLFGAAPLATVGGQVLLSAARCVPVAPAQFALAGSAVTLRYNSQVEYTRAPPGPGYSARRIEDQARPGQLGGARPASIQRNDR